MKPSSSTVPMLLACYCMAGMLTACVFSGKRSLRIEGDIPITGNNRVELVNERNGNIVTTSRIENGKLDMVVDSLGAGVYVLSIYWPRTLVSPKERINRIKTGMEGGRLEHALLKYLYIDPGTARSVRIRLDEAMTQEQMEAYLWKQDPRLTLRISSSCEDTQIFEEAEQLLNDFRIKHLLERDSLKRLLYQIEPGSGRYAKITQEMNTLWANKYLPEMVETHKSLMRAHPNSAVTPYLIYSNVQNAEEFEEYRDIYENMGKKAKRSGYARALLRFANNPEQ
ncbi:hypothetical protein SAMN05421747_1085 [Parapedobacter composti]|uniref:DUF4369 domain-containing protein n=1 Tax=Parapedobacter composti TaxID=623281 RepID=A0A1I1I298_9SPHI|nr:hypothetical protein [Parapedobacter composti]SFC30155.1 hypothetical protein SAMN05421747_1085 [Parapedobacter composti]